MNAQKAKGTVYMVVRDDDIGAKPVVPAWTIDFGPKRRTLKWRGRKFNVPTFRVVGVRYT